MVESGRDVKMDLFFFVLLMLIFLERELAETCNNIVDDFSAMIIVTPNWWPAKGVKMGLGGDRSRIGVLPILEISTMQ